jgi:hypothetical protein
MTSLDLLHIPTPWHNSVVQLAGSDVVLVTKAKLARAALAAGSMTGGLVGAEDGRAHFALEKKGVAVPDVPPTSPVVVAVAPEKEVIETESKKDPAVTVTVTVMVEEKDVTAPGKLQKRTTFSEKADAVVAAVVRRNTGGLSAGQQSCAAKHGSWLGARLRWILSLFWPRGV